MVKEQFKRTAELVGSDRIFIRADSYSSITRKIQPEDRDEWPHLFRDGVEPKATEQENEETGDAEASGADELLELVKKAYDPVDLDALAEEAAELSGHEAGKVKRAITKRRKELG